jgi:hypothetical protein
LVQNEKRERSISNLIWFRTPREEREQEEREIEMEEKEIASKERELLFLRISNIFLRG